MSQLMKIGILTASDRASLGIYEDLSGPAIAECLHSFVKTPWESIRRIVPDDLDTIRRELIRLVDQDGCSLVVTTGGTGPAPRDITPEATEAVCDKILPGFGEMMRAVSLRKVPTAILSRQLAGTRGKCLIVNLPGKPGSIRECLEAVFPAIPYCIELIGGPIIEGKPEAPAVFRPHP